MPRDYGSEGPTAFTSWKEIAAYLGKGVRTVQRWECKFGLPVRRPNRSSRSVYLSRHDLDHWLATRWSHRSAIAKSTVPDNGGEAGVPTSGDIKNYRESRSAHRRLLGEMEQALQRLEQTCRALVVRANDARTPRLRPFLLADDLEQHRQSSPPPACDRAPTLVGKGQV